MNSPAEPPRRPRTVIQWHDDGSKPRARNFLSDDATSCRALIFAGAMAVVSIAAVVSVIQYQRSGGLPDVGNLVETAEASPDSPPKLLPANAVAAKSVHAAALPANESASSDPTGRPKTDTSGTMKSARIEPNNAPAEPDAASRTAPAPAVGLPAGEAPAKALALAEEGLSGTPSSLPKADAPSKNAETALESLKGPEQDDGAEMTAVLSYAPVETIDGIPVPQAAPRDAETVAAISDEKAEERPRGAAATVRSAVNLRARPSDGAKVLLTIPRGARIQVADNCRHWCAVTYDGRSGFVYKSFVRR